MKITRTTLEFNPEQFFNVSCDVHKEWLYFFAAEPGVAFEVKCRNQIREVEKTLKAYAKQAEKFGRKTVRVICEPTGQYDRILLRTAHRLGFATSYVNTESMSKYRLIETNDTGKTDTKDPRVMDSLVKQNKVLRCRQFSPEYVTLRQLGAFAEDEELAIVRIKNDLHRLVFDLFCEYDFKQDFLYSKTGTALVELFGCSPYRIVSAGYKKFSKKMRTAVKRVRHTTLQRLWESAETSVLHQLSACHSEALESRIRSLYADWQRHHQRKTEYEQQMIEILNRLREDDPNIPPPTPHVISEKNMAKLLAETGPLSDFKSWRQVLRYAGLNLCEKQSGNYKGKIKISKKGRPRLRKILGNIVLPLVPRHKLYGDYYHRKKEVDKMCGAKAMTAVARNFLRKFFGWYRAGGGQFNEVRFFGYDRQQSEQQKAA